MSLGFIKSWNPGWRFGWMNFRVGRSSGEGEPGVGSLDGLLARAPGHDGLSLLQGQGRESELWNSGLPGQRLGFVQGESKELFVGAERLAEFMKDGVPGLLDLCDELSARRDAIIREGLTAGRVVFHVFNVIHTSPMVL